MVCRHSHSLVVLSLLAVARAHWNLTSTSSLDSSSQTWSSDPTTPSLDSSSQAWTSDPTTPSLDSSSQAWPTDPAASTAPIVSPPPPSPTTSVVSTPPPSPTSSVAPPPPPTTNSTGPAQKNPKRGIAFAAGNTPNDILNANQSSSVTTWVYDWANTPPSYLATSGLEYVPLQWGSPNIEDFIPNAIACNATHVLGFNEPDFDQESNILPSQAASLWMQYIEPLSSVGVKLGAPAVTASGTGKPWLIDFFAACTNCTIDFIPLHWYGTGTEGFYNYLWDIHTQFPNKTLWVTEYADTSSNDTEVAAFLNATTIYLDGLDWIERYAWFGYFRTEAGVDYTV
ncbi:hypothetical protein BDN72DRAFT_540155 [Pluteus cervinus]|uniref:Uncharacterized protein n=1 Tax=Pluteus cervinus TaxID=181527 RepID=A0ACD3AY63_9AGAR|nr:hypothetical protein BDN72DRAFT_540155 [Pluteus cervinus]